MTLMDQVRAALAGIAVPNLAPQQISANDSGQKFQATLTICDSIACAFDEFVLRSDQLTNAGIAQLKEVAERLSANLTYLLEPIRPIEVDPDLCAVQMRSLPPQQDEDGAASYYELQVRRGGELTLCRYLKRPGQPRDVVPAHVTREVFLRLVSDFSAASA